MSSEEKTYQPGWGEQKKHRHHRPYDEMSKHRNRKPGGSLRMRDRQAYRGLVCVIAVAVSFGAYKLFMLFWNEWRAMPHEDPATEIQVDELRIHKADEQEALLLGDSLSRAYNVDSIKRQVQIETRPVYRPPRREDKWYITRREWKKIWEEWKLMRKDN